MPVGENVPTGLQYFLHKVIIVSPYQFICVFLHSEMTNFLKT